MEMTVLGKNAKYAIAAAIAVVLFFLFDSPLTVGVKAKLVYLIPVSDSRRDDLIRTWCTRAFIGSSDGSACYLAYSDKDYGQRRADCRFVNLDMQNNPKSWISAGVDNLFLYLGDNPRFISTSGDRMFNLAVCDGVE